MIKPKTSQNRRGEYVFQEVRPKTTITKNISPRKPGNSKIANSPRTKKLLATAGEIFGANSISFSGKSFNYEIRRVDVFEICVRLESHSNFQIWNIYIEIPMVLFSYIRVTFLLCFRKL